MSLIIELTPEEAERLQGAARAKGIPPAELARRFVTERLGDRPQPGASDDPMLALFREWEAEDERLTPEEVAEENRQWADLKDSINEERDRAGARRAF